MGVVSHPMEEQIVHLLSWLWDIQCFLPKPLPHFALLLLLYPVVCGSIVINNPESMFGQPQSNTVK